MSLRALAEPRTATILFGSRTTATGPAHYQNSSIHLRDSMLLTLKR